MDPTEGDVSMLGDVTESPRMLSSEGNVSVESPRMLSSEGNMCNPNQLYDDIYKTCISCRDPMAKPEIISASMNGSSNPFRQYRCINEPIKSNVWMPSVINNNSGNSMNSMSSGNSISNGNSMSNGDSMSKAYWKTSYTCSSGEVPIVSTIISNSIVPIEFIPSGYNHMRTDDQMSGSPFKCSSLFYSKTPST